MRRPRMRRFRRKFAFANNARSARDLSAGVNTQPALAAENRVAEPMVHRWHKLGDGGFVTAGQVARAIRIVRQQPLDTWYSRTLSGWGGDGYDILRQFRTYCTNEINRRGGVFIRELTDARLHAKMRRHIRCECVWCGAPAAFAPERNRRFCSPECRCSYFM